MIYFWTLTLVLDTVQKLGCQYPKVSINHVLDSGLKAYCLFIYVQSSVRTKVGISFLFLYLVNRDIEKSGKFWFKTEMNSVLTGLPEFHIYIK